MLLWLFSSCGEQGLLSSCSAQSSFCGTFSCCGAWASLVHGVWDLPTPGTGIFLPVPGIEPADFLPLDHQRPQVLVKELGFFCHLFQSQSHQSQICTVSQFSFFTWGDRGGPEHADIQLIPEREALDKNNMLVSFTTYFHGCQIIFLVGFCFKPMPLQCGLGNILDELLAQNLCFSMCNG